MDGRRSLMTLVINTYRDRDLAACVRRDRFFLDLPAANPSVRSAKGRYSTTWQLICETTAVSRFTQNHL